MMDILAREKAGLSVISEDEIPTFTHELKVEKINGKEVLAVTDDLQEHDDFYTNQPKGKKYDHGMRTFSLVNRVMQPTIGIALEVIIDKDHIFRYIIKVPEELILHVLISDCVFIINKFKRPIHLFSLGSEFKEEFFNIVYMAFAQKSILDEIQGNKNNTRKGKRRRTSNHNK